MQEWPTSCASVMGLHHVCYCCRTIESSVADFMMLSPDSNRLPKMEDASLLQYQHISIALMMLSTTGQATQVW